MNRKRIKISCKPMSAFVILLQTRFDLIMKKKKKQQ